MDNFALKAILSAVDRMSPVLKSVSKAAGNTRKYLLDVGTASGNMLGALGLSSGVIGSILAGFSANAIKNALVHFTEYAEGVVNGARAAGLATAEFQRMAYVADQSDVPVEAFTSSIGQLNKRLGLAATGKNKELAGLFQQLGISLRGANGEIVNGADVLPQLADAFQRNENAAVRAKMGTALFGKSWAELLPLLADGSEGIQQNLDRFKSLRSVISEDDLKGAKQLGDQFKDLAFVTKGFQNTIASQLVPVLSPVIEEFIQWAAANKKLIAGEIKTFVQELVTGLRSFDWKGLVNDIRSLVSGFVGLVSAVGGAKNALIILFALMNIQGIVAIAGFTGSIARLGFHLLGLAGTAVPAAVSGVGALTGVLGASNAAALGLLVTLGKLFAAFAVGYAIGTGLNSLINSLTQTLTGDKDATLGGWLNDKINGKGDGDKPITLDEINKERAKQGREPMASLPGQQPSDIVQASAQQNKVSGVISIDINGAPPGTRVTESKSNGGVQVNPKVGYRSFSNPSGA